MTVHHPGFTLRMMPVIPGGHSVGVKAQHLAQMTAVEGEEIAQAMRQGKVAVSGKVGKARFAKA